MKVTHCKAFIKNQQGSLYFNVKYFCPYLSRIITIFGGFNISREQCLLQKKGVQIITIVEMATVALHINRIRVLKSLLCMVPDICFKLYSWLWFIHIINYSYILSCTCCMNITCFVGKLLPNNWKNPRKLGCSQGTMNGLFSTSRYHNVIVLSL